MLRHCFHHPDRQAFAVCMTCRNAVCQSCSTQWDGINYCTACLAARRDASRGGRAIAGWFTLTAGTLAAVWLSVRAMVWAGALIAGLF